MIVGCQSPPVQPHFGPPRPHRPRPRPADQPAARVVAGRYRLLERVGRGPTSTVWRACDELLDRVVAVKQLTAAQPHGLAEARITARVRHPNVAAVHDIVEQDRSYWLVMDHVAAGTLATVLRERGPLPPPVVAALGLQLLAALAGGARGGRRALRRQTRQPAPRRRRTAGARRLRHRRYRRRPHRAGRPGCRRRLPRVHGARTRPRRKAQAGRRPLVARRDPLRRRRGRPPFPHGDPAPTLAAVLLDPHPPARLAGPLRPLLARLLAKDPAERPSHDTIHALLTAAHPATPTPTTLTSPGTGTDLHPTEAVTTRAFPGPAEHTVNTDPPHRHLLNPPVGSRSRRRRRTP